MPGEMPCFCTSPPAVSRGRIHVYPKWLTAPQIRYLLAMKELDKDGAGVRSVQIASALGLSKPSIHTMLNTFREMGLIQKAEYGAACFTARGLDVVTRYSSY